MAAQQAGRGKAPRMTIETAQTEPTPAEALPKPSPKANDAQATVSRPEQQQPVSKPKMVVAPTPVAERPEVDKSEPLPSEEAWEEPTREYVAQSEQMGQEQVQQVAAQQKKSVATMRRSFTGWVKQTFPGHEHAFYGALVALVLALLVFAIGIVRVLFICVLVVLGVAVGQILDGDPKIIRAVQELFSNERRER